MAKDNTYGMTPSELIDAKAQGMTPGEWVAAYGSEKQKAEADATAQGAGPARWASESPESKTQQEESAAASSSGAEKPKETGAGMTSQADSISTAQAAKQAGQTPPTGPTTAQLEKQFANDPWSQLGAGLVKELQQEQAPIEKAVSGGDTAGNQQTAMNTALATLGQSAGGGASQWLNSNIAKANAADQPMQAAMNAYGKAYSAGQQGVDMALGNLGQANQLGVATAPEQTWLADLATHIQSNLNYSGTVPDWAKNLPDALKYYLQQSGQTGGTGTVPVTSLTVPGQKATPNGLNSIAGAAPGALSTPAALTSGGGSAPG